MGSDGAALVRLHHHGDLASVLAGSTTQSNPTLAMEARAMRFVWI
jgi:hypothetical protein